MPKTRELTYCCCAGRGVKEEVKRDTRALSTHA
ncbi:hypothetical protein GBAR_LOCUS19871 [Geodia barretti]|uniref:Uncharacterized protein n=1 Tax=Geodia barretti TaxID=519541 RepID=A0AA35SSL8_GEOBA|nr:hypothetical protein GBAR_LOCUS19871 [Geodia barretti]